MREVPVRDVMTGDVFAMTPETSIETAARVLTRRHLSGAPVVTAAGQPIGVVSLSDLLRPREEGGRSGVSTFYLLADGRPIEMGVTAGADGVVEDVMTHNVISVDCSTTLLEAAALMTERGVHRLLVMEGSQLAGIVTTLDLLRGILAATRM